LKYAVTLKSRSSYDIPKF